MNPFLWMMKETELSFPLRLRVRHLLVAGLLQFRRPSCLPDSHRSHLPLQLNLRLLCSSRLSKNVFDGMKSRWLL